MITEVKIKNCLSIVDATIPLSPFTIIIGANGTGKSNFIRTLKNKIVDKHFNYPDEPQEITFINDQKDINIFNKHGLGIISLEENTDNLISLNTGSIPHKFANFIGQNIDYSYSNAVAISVSNNHWELDHLGNVFCKIIRKNKTLSLFVSNYNFSFSELKDIHIYSINSSHVGCAEDLKNNPQISEDGSGVVRVLDSLKTGDREDLFNLIESKFKSYIPEIEKLSFVSQDNKKRLQVREKYIDRLVPISKLSEGTRLVLAILTIVYQENPPKLICIEEIDKDLHPRLFEKIVQLCFDITSEKGAPQIIATTHNPYFIDEFKDNEEAVIIVEKEKGETKFSTFADRIKNVEVDDHPLGSLWYSGFVGGVPQ